MARVRDVQIDEVPEDCRPIYQRFASEYGPFLNQVKVFAHRPPALRHLMAMLLEFSDETVLPKRYLEIALVVVSKLTECPYCVAHHAPRLQEQGVSVEAVENILDAEVPGFDELDHLVRDYAIKVSNTPYMIRDGMFDKLKAHFSEEQIVELTLRTALCGFFNRFNDALQIEMEDGVMEDMLSRGFTKDSLPSHKTVEAAE
jgi:uncharacterized peroxidase-related enzyme